MDTGKTKSLYPENEAARVTALRRYQVLDTSPEAVFDDIAQLATQICKTPIALITFIDTDRLWIKSKVGWKPSEVPRDVSFCAHAILQPDCFVVPDTMADPRFSKNPLVTASPYLRFYAAVPIVVRKKYPLGTLCVMDYVVRDLTQDEISGLYRLARQILSQLELKLNNVVLKQSIGKQRRIEKRFRAVFKQAAIGIAWVDAERKVIEGNNALMKMLGYNRAELINQRFDLLTHPADVAADVALFEELFKNKRDSYQIEKRYLRKDGTVAWGRKIVSLVRKSDGEPEFAVVMVEDITEKKKLEDERIDLYHILHAVIKAAPLAMITLARDGTVIGWNPSAERIFGWGAQEIIGHPLPIVPDHKRDEFKMLSKRVLQGGAVTGFETIRWKKDGSFIDVNISTALLYDEKQKIKGIVALIEDISERKEREKVIKEMNEMLELKNFEIAQISEARTRFFSYISHELKIPLNSIVGFTSLVLDGKYGRLTGTQSSSLKRVLINAKELAQLINNILDLAKVNSGKMKAHLEEVDLVDLIEGVAANFKQFFEEKGLLLEMMIDPSCQIIFLTDPAYLRSLLSNLLSNAIKFTQKGRVRIELKPLQGRGGIELKVSDTGIGIHPENLSKLFEEYEHSTFTKEALGTYTSGTGLGLAIVKKIVSSLGGTIEVESAVGEGTTITVELPEQRRD